MNFRFQISDFRFVTRAALAAVVFFALPHFTRAADATAEAILSDTTTEIGHAVELEIKVSGARNAEPPRNISISGLSIGGMSQSSNSSFNFINGSLSSSSSTTFTFPVIPERAGTFTIPSFTLDADGKKLTTRPLTLTVRASGSGGASTGGSAPNNAGTNAPASETNGRIAFAELIIPKQTAYVGEAIPTEFRVYFDARIRVQANQQPSIKGEGLTIQKFAQPREEQIQKDGQTYNFVTYKTAITPVKSGKLTLGPVELPFVAVVPVKRNAQRPRLGNGLDAFFNDPFFNNAFGGYEQRQMVVKSDGLDIDVKPLPEANKPKTFSGAVGQFDPIKTEANPANLKAGDPITLTLKISGRGNFERVNAPHMIEEAGWRSYPASGKFTQDDDVGISGTKVFEMALIPEEKKTKLPRVEFSYFDPAAEKYVTLNAERLPIVVEGKIAQPTTVASAAAPAAPSPTAAKPAKKTDDIHYIVTGPARWGGNFSPIYLRAIFWQAQAVPLVALLGFVGFQIYRRRDRDSLAKQLAEWKREKGELMKTLHRADVGAENFYDAAVRCIQIEAARISHVSPSTIGASEAVAAKPLDEAAASGVGSVFHAREELLYAGGAVTKSRISDDVRRRVLETINEFENATA